MGGGEREDGSVAADLRALREILLELSSAPDADSLRRRAAELGRERLGLVAFDFEGSGDWFLDPEGLLCGRDCHEGHESAGPKRETVAFFAGLVAYLVDRRRAEDELRVLASTDDLTGAVNRRTALIILEKQLGICGRSAAPLAVCLADIDSLKLVNDSFGHRAGDGYIRLVCASLVGAVRASDTVGRLGGDEFLVIFPDCGRDEAEAIMERVDRAIAEAGRELPYRPALSWGIASMAELEPSRATSSGEDSSSRGSGDENSNLGPCVEDFLELADRRMYERKRDTGRSLPQRGARQ